METPILDFLREYRESGISRLHMPGHKGFGPLGCESLDITEIRGSDELYFPEGIIAESERNAASLFGTGITAYSVEGSSHAIRSMLILAKQLFFRGSGRPLLLAARNAHKALLYSAALCDLDICWMYPSRDAENSVAACQLTPGILRDTLEVLRAQDRLPFAVYVTSPDYLGQQADILAMAGICHSYGLPLLVDNAHGAYLHFLEAPCHPMDLGADLCCDSAHKTLHVLTGGAYLHVRHGLCDMGTVKAAMEMTGTTSPSYLILASLDAANRELAEDYPTKLTDTLRRTDRLKQVLREAGIPVLPSEALKVVIHAAAMGFTGAQLGQLLRAHRCEPEFCDADYLVCMLTPHTREEDFVRLEAALREAAGQKLPPRKSHPLRLFPLEQVIPIREAVFAPHAIIPVTQAEGRICGSPTVSCPPAIPIAVSGERMTRELIPIFQSYGIENVNVLL